MGNIMTENKQTMSPSWQDMDDFDDASRGLIGSLKPAIIKDSKGHMVNNLELYSFFANDCPPTVNPKLWRYGQLLSNQGLYEVSPGIYQVRGLDNSNMTLVEGKTGVIVIDPLVSNETADAALNLYWDLRGSRRPVTAMIFSHCHLDHFGGGQGIVDANIDKQFPIIAPSGFTEEALSENTLVGPAMRLRSAYMRGTYLPRSTKGQLGDGLGLSMSSGSHSCLPPTIHIKKTGEEHTIDGIRMLFQSVSGTEAPAEVNIYFPNTRALFISECATHTHHNVLPLRGTVVRDAKLWSQGLDETMTLYGSEAEVLFAGHHWPTWGREKILKLLCEQRDFYAYLHDQTIRMANTGMTGAEIAEHMVLPDQFLTAWHLQGYYGSISHNVKAIYQKYLGWFDGRPNTLWQYPAAEEGQRYAEAFGGVDELVKAGVRFLNDKKDLRFACTLLAHANYANPSHKEAKNALASCYEQLGYGSENATWRNFYLTGAHELLGRERYARGAQPLSPFGSEVPTDQMLSALAVKLDGPKAASSIPETKTFYLKDGDCYWRINVSNGALTYRVLGDTDSSVKTVGNSQHLSREEFVQLMVSKTIPETCTEQQTQDLTMLLSVLSI